VDSVEIRLPMLAGYSKMKDTSIQCVEAFRNLVDSSPGWAVEPVNHEGLRVMVGRNGNSRDGWVMLRSSLHEPIMSVQIESDSQGGVRDIVASLLAYAPLAKHVDTKPLEKFLGASKSVK